MDRPESGVGLFRRHTRTPADSLFRRICLINGLVFTLGTLVLAFSPATVSSRVQLTEVPVLAVGLAVILTANDAWPTQLGEQASEQWANMADLIATTPSFDLNDLFGG